MAVRVEAGGPAPRPQGARQRRGWGGAGAPGRERVGSRGSRVGAQLDLLLSPTQRLAWVTVSHAPRLK